MDLFETNYLINLQLMSGRAFSHQKTKKENENDLIKHVQS